MTQCGALAAPAGGRGAAEGGRDQRHGALVRRYPPSFVSLLEELPYIRYAELGDWPPLGL